MKRANGYRYTIQFGCITPEHEAVGEYLEGLKNKKAECIVRAVSAYILRGKAGDTALAKHRKHVPLSVLNTKATVEQQPQSTAADNQLDAMLELLECWSSNKA